MKIMLNGEERTLNGEWSLTRLMEELQLPPQRVAVEVNRQLVTRACFGQTLLHEGDQVEIVTLVGGG
ncbi:MAG: hypothetical protein HJJLKODD_02839 [Phycisphaerae bacterium]|nr:hypothetical protein [Phycisphaerae bacterium]